MYVTKDYKVKDMTLNTKGHKCLTCSVCCLTVMNYGARLENFEGVWMTNSQPRQPGQELGSSAVPGHYS